MKTLSIMAAGLSFVAPPLMAQSSAQTSVAMTDQQKAVWQGEVDYWTYVNRGDLTGYLTLWRPTFRGWPCGSERPSNFSSLPQSSAKWFSDRAKAGESTTPEIEAVVVDDDVAITYLSALTVWTNSDGVKQSRLQKFVHTWKATNGGWKIIGGMCAPLERKTTRVDSSK